MNCDEERITGIRLLQIGHNKDNYDIPEDIWIIEILQPENKFS